MSFLTDFIDFIAEQTGLIVDTNLFIAAEPVDAPDSLTIITASGGYENESGLQLQPVQVISKDLTFLSAQTLAYKVHNVLNHKPGFSGLDGYSIFYCQSITMPQCLGQDERSRWIFSTNFYIRRK